jgi:hypothetical protein
MNHFARNVDTNHRWLIWLTPRKGQPHIVAASDDRTAAELLAARSHRLSVQEHIAWLPTTTVRVRRLIVPHQRDLRLGQIYPPDGEILAVGSEPVGRGMVISIEPTEFAVAVPVLPPAVGEGPSLWALGRDLAARSAQA